jgi:hypothetical protein
MDRLIWVAWRAFWVGLGASAVLLAQTFFAPVPAAVLPGSTFTPPSGEMAPSATPSAASPTHVQTSSRTKAPTTRVPLYLRHGQS